MHDSFSMIAFHYEFLQYILEELFYSVQSYSVRTHDKINMKQRQKKNQLTSVMNAKSDL